MTRLTKFQMERRKKRRARSKRVRAVWKQLMKEIKHDPFIEDWEIPDRFPGAA